MIKTLVSNIKTQNMEFRHRFQAPYVLLTGRNGSGKSGLIHALELAVFGQVYDAAGKDIKSKGLVAMLTSGGEPVVAQAMTTDNMRYDFHEASGPKLTRCRCLLCTKAGTPKWRGMGVTARPC